MHISLAQAIISQTVYSVTALKGSEQVTPECVTLTRGLFWTKGNQDPANSGKAFYLLLNCLKETRKGACNQEESYHQRLLFYLRVLCAWQDKNSFTKHLLSSPSCEVPSSPLKPQTPIPFLIPGWYISVNCLGAFEPRSLWGSHKYVFSPFKLFIAGDLSQEPRRVEGNIFLHLQHLPLAMTIL